ncbi:MAG: PIN domain-containing protein, partial [Dehalococcoidia bacterium]
VVWTPAPTEGHSKLLASLIREYNLRANMIPDAHLAALAIGHGLTLYSVDTDFARFRELAWVNPLS